MTEGEKRQLALSIFAAEQARLRSPLAFPNARIQASLARSERQRKVFASLAQNGITWEQLKAAYDEALERGKGEMIQFNMGFFYAGMAIAYHECAPGDVLDFLHDVAVRMGKEASTEEIIKKTEGIIDMDLRSFDTPPQPISKGSRRDNSAVERMKRTGITQKDLDYERETGYKHGRNSEFFLSACYAAVVLVLSDYGWTNEAIESFIEHVDELKYEEITRADIMERAARETGIDVEGIL